MQRRKFIQRALLTTGAVTAAGAGGWYHFFDGPIFNPCQLGELPEALASHELMAEGLEGIEMNDLWDCHFHLVGNGLNPALGTQKSGAWLNPSMLSWMNPKQRIQYAFYLNAGCVDNSEFADKEFIENLRKMLNSSPPGVRYMLLAFDYYHDDEGSQKQSLSTFHIPNEYAAAVAGTHKQLEWIASVHPYRDDAIEALQWCKDNGAKAVKWLPPAMNIDPSSAKCDKFYEKLIELNLSLLSHAGEEQAVHSDELQKLANPLFLRKPLDMGVKVIVAHCASLGTSVDIEASSPKEETNLNLFGRLMDDHRYENNLLADISAINLFNRKIEEIKLIIERQDWHSRLLYASDSPLPGVPPIISSTNLASHGLLDNNIVDFLNQVRRYNSWLFDLLQKRFLQSNKVRFSDQVFSTRRHFS